MENIFNGLTSDYRMGKLITNVPIPFLEHLSKRAHQLMLPNRAPLVRFCLNPDFVDFLLGFLNEEEEEEVGKKIKERLDSQKPKEMIPSSKGGFYVRPKFKYWHSW